MVVESDFEEAVADAAPPGDPAAPTEVDLDTPTPAVLEGVGDDEPTETELVAPAGLDEETGTGIPLPTFSEAPTMEIPAVTDNLRAVRGIGPSMERKLHGLGIISYRQRPCSTAPSWSGSGAS